MRDIFVLHCSEDGDKSLEVMSEEEFLQKLEEEWWGKSLEIVDSLPEHLDYFAGLIVIRGDLIQPKPIEVVKKWAL